MLQKIKESADFIKGIINYQPEVGLILGSGLGTTADEIENKSVIPYSEIPNFPTSTVKGHAGNLVLGTYMGKRVAAMQGRFHFYEGYALKQVTFPVYVMKMIGIDKIVVTNAAGGLRNDLEPGSLMIIEDHINMIGTNPLIGENFEELGPRFPDMSNAYDKELIKLAQKCADEIDIDVKKGVYTAISGPYYLSKAELRMLITLGSDAVGMSTVPEVIVANYLGMKTLGISCITDNANPDNMIGPTHEEIVKIAEKTRPKFIKLVEAVVENI